tara:strand:- start:679 stop:1713 length:1035 start_codon:yes stop_codon:yes gene_type:complete
MKKKKIFLAAYLNYTNAQNLNCLSLSNYLDKEKFDVYGLTSHFGNKNLSTNNVRLFNCFKPFIVTKYLGFIWGILICDIIYLPKHREVPVWMLKLSKLLKRKLFTTIEINMCDRGRENMISNFGGSKRMQEYFSFIPNIYGISKYLVKNSNCGVKLNPFPLYLGVDNKFSEVTTSTSLLNLVFIGSLIKRKNLDEVLKLAGHFKNLKFHIIGEGKLRKELEIRATNNVIFYGKLSHNEIIKVLNKVDLNILLSRSEGFPKVILETASAGIPSLVYNDYGAEEWIMNNKNGFVLKTIEEVFFKIKELINVPELLVLNSKGTVKLAKNFAWKVQIKEWEKEILKLK